MNDTTKKKVVKKKSTKKAKRASTMPAAKKAAPISASESELLQPLISLRRQVEDAFDRYFHGWADLWPRHSLLKDIEREFPFKGFGRMPTVDMSENDKGYTITAELPGMEEKDIEINLTDDMLTIEGEKQEKHEQAKKDYHFRERRYGHFRRSMRVPSDADAGKITASFKQGILSVEIPKTGGARKRGRKIAVKNG